MLYASEQQLLTSKWPRPLLHLMSHRIINRARARDSDAAVADIPMPCIKPRATRSGNSQRSALISASRVKRIFPEGGLGVVLWRATARVPLTLSLSIPAPLRLTLAELLKSFGGRLKPLSLCEFPRTFTLIGGCTPLISG